MARVEELELSTELESEIAPILAVMAELNRQVDASNQKLGELAKEDESIRRLCTAPGVGPVTATAFVSTVDEVGRFRGAHQLQSYLGLTPREMSSGEKQHRGAITKAGNGRLRWVLVESAWCLLRNRRAGTVPLRLWAERIAKRRGRRVALVALARKLAGILYEMAPRLIP